MSPPSNFTPASKDEFYTHLVFAIQKASDHSEVNLLFQVLWNRLENSVTRAVKSILRNYPNWIDIVCSDVQDKVREGIIKYEIRSDVPFACWIRKVTRTTALNLIRREKKNIHLSRFNQQGAEIPFEDGLLIDEDYIKRETIEKLGWAISKLPEIEGKVVEMMDYEGLPIKEVSRILQISEDLVKQKHYKAKRRMKKLLKSQDITESIKS